MAKNVFGILNTADRIDGEKFIVRSNSPEMLEKLDQISGEAQTLAAQNAPSRRLALLRTLSLALGSILLIFGIMKANSVGNFSFAGIFQTSPVVMAFAVAAILLSVVLSVLERNRMKKAERVDALDEWRERSKAAQEEAYRALEVPQDAISMDLFTVTYTQKNGVMRSGTYTAFDFRAWVENDCLCLADVESVVAIPLDSLKEISEIVGKTQFYFWNKEESPGSENYRQYHTRRTYLGAYSVKGVRVAHIRSDFGEYELLIPPYELETFLQLTGKAIRPGTDGK